MGELLTMLAWLVQHHVPQEASVIDMGDASIISTLAILTKSCLMQSLDQQ